jgi:hypothetical protein
MRAGHLNQGTLPDESGQEPRPDGVGSEADHGKKERAEENAPSASALGTQLDEFAMLVVLFIVQVIREFGLVRRV